MTRIEETEISKAILCTYHEKLLDRIISDVLIVGSGPAGMTAAIYLARQGFKVTILEKRLSPGGGIWGGGIGMNEVIFQEDAWDILDDFGIQHSPRREGLHATNAVELGAGLSFRAIQSGAAIFNLLMAEDICVRDGRAIGVVVNRTMIGGALPVDPITFTAKAVIDTTGHEAVMTQSLLRRGMLTDATAAAGRGEGPMDADTAETFVVENTREVFPGLWVAGMSVSAALGGPRMGPIFGGMLLSGKRAAERIADSILPSVANE